MKVESQGFEASREGGKAGERAALLAAEGTAPLIPPRASVKLKDDSAPLAQMVNPTMYLALTEVDAGGSLI